MGSGTERGNTTMSVWLDNDAVCADTPPIRSHMKAMMKMKCAEPKNVCGPVAPWRESRGECQGEAEKSAVVITQRFILVGATCGQFHPRPAVLCVSRGGSRPIRVRNLVAAAN